MLRDEFRLVHYAGEVTYSVIGFLDKNNDLLFRDLKETLSKAGNKIVRSCFPEQELRSKKRPETAITQFRTSLNNLMDILMCKEPSYIRCIKPNDLQSPGVFNDQLVLHQVKYLGLMENLRVRRAGFAYRRAYDLFLERYKCLSKSTWPNYKGAGGPKAGVQQLVKDLGYDNEQYKMGETKLFIRWPRTLFDTEDSYQAKKHDIAAIIQAHWKGVVQRRKYLKLGEQVIVLQRDRRRRLAQRPAKQRREAADKIRVFIKGFITRNDPPNRLQRGLYLPMTSVLDKSWPSAPTHWQEASEFVHRLHRLHLARIYRLALTPQRKRQFELTFLAEKVFKGKKNNYAASVGTWFQEDRIPKEHIQRVTDFVASTFGSEQLKYQSFCTKLDRQADKSFERFISMSNKAV
ncbi:GL10077 [Drosophila persimilis]|uniref:GL10077 n=1 Tax=Drosophila persimilis TaxID=7234 RepID=B4IRL7_DROPE|nr:GL10077 [Drosophila persimilis]